MSPGTVTRTAQVSQYCFQRLKAQLQTGKPPTAPALPFIVSPALPGPALHCQPCTACPAPELPVLALYCLPCITCPAPCPAACPTCDNILRHACRQQQATQQMTQAQMWSHPTQCMRGKWPSCLSLAATINSRMPAAVLGRWKAAEHCPAGDCWGPHPPLVSPPVRAL